jgi:hypothetical protein
MLKEAILGDEPYRPDPGRQALEASVAKFERRMRTVRFMTLIMVTFATAVFFTGLVLFLGAGAEATVRELLIYAGLFFFGLTCVGMGKMWFAMMHNHIALMKEIKVTQIRIVEARAKE